MNLKISKSELKNKIFIKIWNDVNTTKKHIIKKMFSIKTNSKFKIFEESVIQNWKIDTNLFVIIKDYKNFERNLEEIVIELSKIIKKLKSKFSMSLKHLKLPDYLEESFVELLAQSLYSFNKYVKKEKKYMLNINSNLNSEILTKKINTLYWARDLMNMPSNDLNPDSYEEIIKKTFRWLPVKIKVIKWEELFNIWAWWIYSVWKWSDHVPRMIILSYKPKKNEKYSAIIWKWVTFDSWGYNIKPTWHIEDMNLDMWWSAVALWIFKFLVETNYSWNLVCWIWIVENLVSSKSYTPTDIVKMYNGKTVKITNTDAEWRLVLADTLSYVEKNFDIWQIFDFATLTWAAIVALWHDIIAIMWNNEKLLNKIEKRWSIIKERAYKLPLHNKYKKLLKTSFADITNCSKSIQAWTIVAGLFLSEFVKSSKWVHFDIAWPCILENNELYWSWWSWIWIRLWIKLFS